MLIMYLYIYYNSGAPALPMREATARSTKLAGGQYGYWRKKKVVLVKVVS